MRGIQGSFRSETTDWEEGAWEGLGGLTRESVEQDASVPKKGQKSFEQDASVQKKGKSFERDASVPVSSKDGTVCQRAFSLSCNSTVQRTWYTRLG